MKHELRPISLKTRFKDTHASQTKQRTSKFNFTLLVINNKPFTYDCQDDYFIFIYIIFHAIFTDQLRYWASAKPMVVERGSFGLRQRLAASKAISALKQTTSILGLVSRLRWGIQHQQCPLVVNIMKRASSMER